MSTLNPFVSLSTYRKKTDRSSIRSGRPPTYTSHATTAPTYAPRTTRAQDRPTTSSVAPDTVFNDSESTITSDTAVSEVASAISKPAGPRYIYYRVYTEDGAIPSANPVYSDDPYLGRILAKLVAPPHTAANVKNCVARFEHVVQTPPVSLFINASSQSPMEDAGRLSILRYPGPGSTPNEPLALFAKCDISTGRRLSGGLAPEKVPEGLRPFEHRYIFYQVFKVCGGIPSKHPVDPNDPYVGYICVDIIPPPHTAESIKRCICIAEDVVFSKELQLFASISSESPIAEGHMSILTSDFPGSTPEDPVAFVELQTPPTAQLPNPIPPAFPIGSTEHFDDGFSEIIKFA